MAVHIKQLLVIVVVAILYTKAATQPMSLPNCPSKCGTVTIPYPFGTREDCSLDNTFLIDCNQTSQVPFLPENKNISVRNITLDGELRVAWPIASDCYTKNGNRVNRTYQDINMTHFHISTNKNKFIAIGCNTVGIIEAADSRGNSYGTGCVAYCKNPSDVDNGSCSGVGCCEISIPERHMLTEVFYGSSILVLNNYSSVYDFNSCGYAFMVENGKYSFKSTNLKLEKKEFPVVLDWAVGNQTCEQAQKNLSNYACKADKSTCYNSTERPGYLCKCVDGYQGNPYLQDGCKVLYISSLLL